MHDHPGKNKTNQIKTYIKMNVTMNVTMIRDMASHTGAVRYEFAANRCIFYIILWIFPTSVYITRNVCPASCTAALWNVVAANPFKSPKILTIVTDYMHCRSGLRKPCSSLCLIVVLALLPNKYFYSIYKVKTMQIISNSQ